MGRLSISVLNEGTSVPSFYKYYTMKINELLGQTSTPSVAYHVTTETNAKSILRTGLEPRNDAHHNFYDDGPRIYLIVDTKDISTVAGWLSARLENENCLHEEDCSLTLLKIDVTGLELIPSLGTTYTTKPISPDRITDLGWRGLGRYY
jgi:hypothetical protein